MICSGVSAAYQTNNPQIAADSKETSNPDYHVGYVACDDRVALAVNESLKTAEDDADRPEIGE